MRPVGLINILNRKRIIHGLSEIGNFCSSVSLVIELNTRTEIQSKQATVCYFIYYLNILLARSWLDLRFKKGTRCQSFIVPNRASDMSAADWLSQKREKFSRFFSVVETPLKHSSLCKKSNNKYAAIYESSLQHLSELAGIDQFANKRRQFCLTEFRFRSNWPCSVGMTCLVTVRQIKGAPFADWLNHVTNSDR